MTRTVKVEGFRELDKALAELPKSTGKAVLRRVGKGALQPMAATARSLAPKATGDLELSIIVGTARTKRAKEKPGFRKMADGRVRQAASNHVNVAMGPASGKGVLQYASFVEFGTDDTAPQPFMRPAWSDGAANALEYIRKNLGFEIAKAAKRLAKKRQKAK